MVQIPAIPGVALIRLPFDILSAAYVLTVIALAETKIITLPNAPLGHRSSLPSSQEHDLSHTGLYL